MPLKAQCMQMADLEQSLARAVEASKSAIAESKALQHSGQKKVAAEMRAELKAVQVLHATKIRLPVVVSVSWISDTLSQLERLSVLPICAPNPESWPYILRRRRYLGKLDLTKYS